MKPILEIKKISKKFRIHSERQPYLSIRDSISSIFQKKGNSKEDFYALKDVSFDVNEGDTVGIIGKNGAGKSTLLKILSKITPPTSGKIISRGRIASLLEVGTGFHPELNGRENIFLNGSILGMKRTEIQKNFDAIVDFSGVERFIDTALKHYSSGMQLRLAFSVAAFLENEILIIDEVLAVGDLEFQKKCMRKMEDVSKSGRTILFVSHNMGAVKQLCASGILLEKGNVKLKDAMNTVLHTYLTAEQSDSGYFPEKIKSGVDVAFKSIEVKNSDDVNCSEFICEDKIFIHFKLAIKKENHQNSLFVIIKDKYGTPVFSSENKINKSDMILVIHENFLTRGSYSLHTFIHIPKVAQFDVADDVCHFMISDTSSPMVIHGEYEYGNVFGNTTWQ